MKAREFRMIVGKINIKWKFQYCNTEIQKYLLTTRQKTLISILLPISETANAQILPKNK